MKNSKEKNYKLKEKKWKLQEDLFCLLSYIIMIGTMVSMIFNPKINLSDNILLIVYITTVIIWLIFIKVIKNRIDTVLDILEAFNNYSASIGIVTYLLFYLAIICDAPMFVLALIVGGSVILSIWAIYYKIKTGVVEKRDSGTGLQFEKLTPTDEINLGIYEDAINFVFSDNEIQNIAVSGSYSAGKSSLLASYKKKYKDKKFMHISLAHFEQENDNGEKMHTKLEGKILNQLLHQVKANKIPMTNFRIKNTVAVSEITKNTIEIVVFILIMCYFIFANQWENFVDEIKGSHIRITLIPEFKFFLGVIELLIICKFVWYIVQYQKNKNIFKKFSIKGNEIELFEEDDASYFDKYLNEVLYLFENSGVDVIVFEDMDRFNTVSIFERLREINGLINAKRMNSEKNNEPLRFFYLLRDDIFTTKDRTKFFDYIIPVVPVMDGSNSYNKFIKILNKNGELETLDLKFLQGMSLFIDDMRLLKNICNEYEIYYHRLNITELDSNKMLAIITYKNIFPRDFNDLQLNKGYIYTLFSKKKDFIEEYNNKINEKIQIIDENLKKIENENLCNREEIGAVFARKYYSDYNLMYESDLIEWIEQHSRNQEVIDELHDRLKIVELKNKNKTGDLRQQKKRLEIERKELREKHLSQLITKDTEEEIFSISDKDPIGRESHFKEVKGNNYYPLLKYLIWNGYIDETYSDYMTYFYEGGIKKEDKMFLRSVAEHRAKDYDYSLNDVEKVANSLRSIDFDQEETLNYDLFEFLLKEDNYVESRSRIINQIRIKKNYDFLVGFVEKKPNIFTKTVINICKFWRENFDELNGNGNINFNFLLKWAIEILCYVPKEYLIEIDKNRTLSSFINKAKMQIMIGDKLIDQFIESALAIDIKLINLKLYHKENNLFLKIIDNNLYKITIENINHILKEVYRASSENEMKTKNFTVLRHHLDTSLYKYIQINIEIYLEELLKVTEEIRDDYDTVIAVFEENNISDNLKQEYAKKLRTEIISISDILYDGAWECIIRKGILVYSEVNILQYFQKKSLTQDLIQFINNGKKELDFNLIEEDTIKEKFFLTIISENNITDKKYEQILLTLGYNYPEFDIEEISSAKMDILINCRIILMDESSLDFIRKNYFDKIKKYIELNFREYLNISKKNDMQEDIPLILEMVCDNIISEENAIKLFNNISGEIQLKQTIYPEMIMINIIEEHLFINDMNFLFDKYEIFTENIKKSIINLGIKNVDKIINKEFSINKQFIIDLLQQKSIDEFDKISLVLLVIEVYNQQDVVNCLELIGKIEFIKLFDPKLRPKFKANRENKQLLDAFMKKGYIQDYSLDEKEKYYHYRRHKK